uniref:peptidylprolyl isomerase n=1 Tax=Panagrellus redivivus TaxID=6233 RepID=A0A7E4V2B6_PANRE
MSKSNNVKRKRAFMDITADGKPLGRIIFELYNDKLPLTCKNFLTLCTGLGGIGQKTGKPLAYKGSHIHRISAGFIIQGGDFSENNGTGGESIYGGVFDDEEFIFKHGPYTLSMANRGPDTNGSQFFITLDGTFPQLDNIHVAFGKVVSGFETVNAIANLEVHSTKLRPVADVVIVGCGELRKKKAKDDDEQSADDAEAEADSGKKDGSKKKKDDSDKRFYCSVKASDLPQVPDTNRFLLRRSPQPVNDREYVVGQDKQADRPGAKRSGDRDEKRRDRDVRYRDRDDRDDRRKYQGYRRDYDDRDSHRRHRQVSPPRVRGRAIPRFRNRSRSWTPPHIRREATRMIPIAAAKEFLDEAYEGALKGKPKEDAEVKEEAAAAPVADEPVKEVSVEAESPVRHRSESPEQADSDEDVVPPDNVAKLIKQRVTRDESSDSEEDRGDRRPKVKLEIMSPQSKPSRRNRSRSRSPHRPSKKRALKDRRSRGDSESPPPRRRRRNSDSSNSSRAFSPDRRRRRSRSSSEERPSKSHATKRRHSKRSTSSDSADSTSRHRRARRH